MKRFLVRLVVLCGILLPAGCRWALFDPAPPPSTPPTEPAGQSRPLRLITFGYDDGHPSIFSLAAPQLEAHGFRGTIYVKTAFQTQYHQWVWWRYLNERGHEIANHTRNHAHLDQIPPDSVDYEVREGQRDIQENVPGAAAVSFSYPYGGRTPEVEAIVAKYEESARGVYGINTLTPPDFYLLAGIDSEPCDTTVAFAAVDSLIARPEGGYLILYFHDIEESPGVLDPQGAVAPQECHFHERIVEYVAEKVALGQVHVMTQAQATALLKGATGIAEEP